MATTPVAATAPTPVSRRFDLVWGVVRQHRGTVTQPHESPTSGPLSLAQPPACRACELSPPVAARLPPGDQRPERKCTSPGCEHRHSTHGYCKAHLWQVET